MAEGGSSNFRSGPSAAQGSGEVDVLPRQEQPIAAARWKVAEFGCAKFLIYAMDGPYAVGA